MPNSNKGEGHIQVSRSVGVTVNGPLEKVFTLFTPEGETHWIPTWKYTPVYPRGEETVRDMVFQTDEQTLWTLAVYEPPRRSVYVHTSPDVLVRIEVACQAVSSRQTAVVVIWVLTSLTERGRTILERSHNEADYAKRAGDWKQWLNALAVKQGW